MAAVYTNATTVKATLAGLTSVADGVIIDHIEDAQQYLRATMGTDWLNITGDDNSHVTYDSDKHGILRTATNAYAAAMGTLINPSNFNSISEAMQTFDRLYQVWLDISGVLPNPQIVNYLEANSAD